MQNLTIKFRLCATLAALALTLLFGVAAGWLSLRQAQEGFATLYSDRVVPLRDLKIVADMYAVNVVDASHKARNGNFSPAEGAASVVEAREKLSKAWTAYLDHSMTPEERRLVAEARPLMAKADDLAVRLTAILERRDSGALDALVRNELYQVIDPVSTAISNLVELQLNVAREVAGAFDRQSQTATVALALAAGIGVLAMLGALLTVFRGVLAPFGAIARAMSRLAGGDLAHEVEGRELRSEIGEMARAVHGFRENALAMLRLQAEQKEAEVRSFEEKRRGMAELADRFQASVGAVVQAVSSAAA